MHARILLSLYEQDSYIQNQGLLLIEEVLQSLTNRYLDLVYNNL